MKIFVFRIIYILYEWCGNRLRGTLRNFVKKYDGGEMYSSWLRRILREYHGVSIGEGSYGGCFRIENVNKNTVIGKYCSIASNVHIYNRDHPCEYVSTHPVFFNERMGSIPGENLIGYRLKVIGNDVWIGQNAILLASAERIGDGAVIGAGAVVTKNVPDYAIVAGVPARIIGYRFDPRTIERIKRSKWWDWAPEKLKSHIKYFSRTDRFIEFINNEQGRPQIR
ncbi:MAG TPA: CatB-related O-acetyltransferase [Clostridia bacterium]|nr:CatB-related O-acetyltransferase [Clostridia bacterium]